MKTLTTALFLLAPFYGLGQTPAGSSGSTPTTAPASAPAGSPKTSSVPAQTSAPAQNQPAPPADEPKVTVTSRGSDIRIVLTNIFAQAKRSLILQPSIQFNLYLALQDTDFTKAIDLICGQAGLKYEIRDGIYHIFQKKTPKSDFPSLPPATPVGSTLATAPESPVNKGALTRPPMANPIGGPKPTPTQSAANQGKPVSSENDFETQPMPPARRPLAAARISNTSENTARPSDIVSPPPKTDTYPTPIVPRGGKLPISVLRRHVTTKLAKAPIGAVLEELGAQAGIKIEIGDNVPAYRLDAVLNNTTLRYALEEITRAAKLTYTLTDHQTILVDAKS